MRGSFLVQKDCSILLGENTRCNGFLNISTAEKTSVTIGSGCLIASAVIRSSDMHPIFDIKTGKRLNHGRNVVIGDDVWLGAESMVLKGSKIGKGVLGCKMSCLW